MERDKKLEGCEKTSIGEEVSTSCERCRRRKIKCDRPQPCTRCRKAHTDCVRGGSGEKQRPVPRSYVQALERQVASLELWIKNLAAAGPEKRNEMLAQFRTGSDDLAVTSPPDIETELASTTSDNQSEENKAQVTLARSKTGQMRRRTASHSSRFYGGTSLFQIHLPAPPDMPDIEEAATGQSPAVDAFSPYTGQFQFAPHDDLSQRLMASFFKHQYQYNMCIYREFFLRDYDTGRGRYYSDLLMFAICAMGALATGDQNDIAFSAVFAGQAHALLSLALDLPDLTVLQALVLLGQWEISQSRASRGWLYCGMAFRLAHEMGLHLDPSNWSEQTEPPEQNVDREILRRVYWATFVVDKELSLYFGRPPALHPYESDVRNTVRLPYPPDWETLLDTYIAPNTSASAYEDGIAFVGAFIYHAELSKLQHSIITDLFENRRSNADNSVVAATVHRLHVSLTKWLSSLPGKLYWNQWTVGQVPSCILHLHMRFHTTMIILHRPPPHLFEKPDVASSEDVEICYESLQAIFRLMRGYARYYRYQHLPLDFVHTLSTAASTISMKRYLENTSWDEANITRSLALIQDAIHAIKDTHPCITEIERSINNATQGTSSTLPPDPNEALDLGLIDWWAMDNDTNMLPGDLGVLLTDDILGGNMPLSQEY